MRKTIPFILALAILLPFAAKAQKGIDVSRFQDSINWKRVAKNSNIEFVYVKATEGASISDPMYKYNITKAKDAGLRLAILSNGHRPRLGIISFSARSSAASG